MARVPQILLKIKIWGFDRFLQKTYEKEKRREK
jgi:hypothetical protein